MASDGGYDAVSTASSGRGPAASESGADGGYDAVSLDVGGVLVVPDHGMLGAALDAAGIPHDRSRFAEGHHHAMAAVDRAASDPEDFTDYLYGFLATVDVPDELVEAAHAALAGVLRTPVWCQPVPGARGALAELAAAGVRLAVTSNSDGTVADLLRRHEWVQVGPGPLVAVEVVTDSGIVGVGKPDRAMFDATAAGLRLPPERVLHVGDSAHYDVAGAVAAGMAAVHMDPFGICPAQEHDHVGSLLDVLALARGEALR
jgi:HAD superfamily hydrolase (TIGR01509 family)